MERDKKSRMERIEYNNIIAFYAIAYYVPVALFL